MKLSYRILLVLTVLMSTIFEAHAEKQTFYPKKDSWIGTRINKSTRGDDDFIKIGGSGDRFYALIQFETPSVPGTITSARLELEPHPNSFPYIMSGVATGGTVYASSTSWRENGTSVTDLRYYSYWSESFSAPRSASRTITVDVTDIVSLWTSSSEGDRIKNNGFVIRPDLNFNTYSYFYSREWGRSRGPKLVVTYKIGKDFGRPFTGSQATITRGPGKAPSHKNNNYYSVDFGLSEGRRIVAAESGYVVRVENNVPPGPQNSGAKAAGNFVKIDHDGDKDQSTGYQTSYQHLQKGSVKVSEKQWVNKGDLIGYSGNTGNVDPPAPNGHHLHFEVRYKNKGAGQEKYLEGVTIDGKLILDLKTGLSF
ncbi:MAG: hypothetical protein QG585_642 [Patescibacteria group bacterium]|nr:hypothetical protein [Patescibacteria group bacterium]